MISVWNERFPSSQGPTHHVFSPGRVNLIGEHVDHQNYSVLPCAIRKGIEALVEVDFSSGPLLEVQHVDSNVYPSVVFETASDIRIADTHKWSNYVVAAYIGCCEYFASGKSVDKVGVLADAHRIDERIESASTACKESPLNHRYRFLISGNLPIAAGLSSSSALVVCATLGLNCGLQPLEVAVICANSERHTGVAGGGMDQATICLSKEGCAQLIGFKPLTNKTIPMPEGIKLVIANTAREAPKARDAAKMYNKRVFELKVASYILLKNAGLEKKVDSQELLNLGLRDVCRTYLKSDEQTLLSKLDSIIPLKDYTKEDIKQLVPQSILDEILTKRCGQFVWDKNDTFKLNERVTHVLTEALRVYQFAEACERLAKETNPVEKDQIHRELGLLLDQSQASLKMSFECSCDELDTLTDLARKAGALGSRLTGAGWGGCTISMVPEERVESFIKELKAKYFEPYKSGSKIANPPLEKISVDIDDLIFETEPGAAAVFSPYIDPLKN